MPTFRHWQLHTMYYGMCCWVQSIVSVEVPVRDLGKPGRVSRNFQKRNETGTMVCTWHTPSYNGFHDLHNEHVDLQNVHVDFGQWLGQVYPRRPVLCAL